MNEPQTVLLCIHGVGNPKQGAIKELVCKGLHSINPRRPWVSSVEIVEFNWNAFVAKPLNEEKLYSRRIFDELSLAIDCTGRLRTSDPRSSVSWHAADRAFSVIESSVAAGTFLSPTIVLLPVAAKAKIAILALPWVLCGLMLAFALQRAIVNRLSMVAFLRTAVLTLLRPTIMVICALMALIQLPLDLAINTKEETFGSGFARLSAYVFCGLTIFLLGKSLLARVYRVR